MPLHNIITCVSCIAQPLPTLLTEPFRGDRVMVDIMVESIITLWTFRTITLQSDGVVVGGCQSHHDFYVGNCNNPLSDPRVEMT